MRWHWKLQRTLMPTAADETESLKRKETSHRRWWLATVLGVMLLMLLACWIAWIRTYYGVRMLAELRAEPQHAGAGVTLAGHVASPILCVGDVAHYENNGELNVRMRYRFICPS